MKNKLEDFLEIEGKGFSAEEKKQLSKFISRLKRYSHVPTNRKEIARMDAFASNQLVVTVVVHCLKQLPYNSDSFDIVSYWYCIALLMQSNELEATTFIDDFVDDFLQRKENDLWLLRRLFSHVDGEKFHLNQEKIEGYFSDIQNTISSYLWAKGIGLELPTTDDWFVYFVINTKGEYAIGSFLSPEEREGFYSLSVRVYPLEDAQSDCFRISLEDMSSNIRNMWTVHSKQTINLATGSVPLQTDISLLNLKNLISEIEEKLSISFNKTIVHKEFRGKIKNRNAVQKWLNQF